MLYRNVARSLMGVTHSGGGHYGHHTTITKHNFLVQRARRRVVKEAFHIVTTGDRDRCWLIYPKTSATKSWSTITRLM